MLAEAVEYHTGEMLSGDLGLSNVQAVFFQ